MDLHLGCVSERVEAVPLFVQLTSRVAVVKSVVSHTKGAVGWIAVALVSWKLALYNHYGRLNGSKKIKKWTGNRVYQYSRAVTTETPSLWP